VRGRLCVVHGPVGAALHAVIVAAELALRVTKVLPSPDIFGLERVPAQNLDEQQVVVRDVLVRIRSLYVL